MMSFVGWSGLLEGTLGTDLLRAVDQMERPTPAHSCAFKAYRTRFPTSQVASRIGVGSGLDCPIAFLGQPTFPGLVMHDRHHHLLDSIPLEVLSK